MYLVANHHSGATAEPSLRSILFSTQPIAGSWLLYCNVHIATKVMCSILLGKAASCMARCFVVQQIIKIATSGYILRYVFLSFGSKNKLVTWKRENVKGFVQYIHTMEFGKLFIFILYM